VIFQVMGESAGAIAGNADQCVQLPHDASARAEGRSMRGRTVRHRR
jgi:hypothetical protein